jgi:multidrug efflux system outer membrane protein
VVLLALAGACAVGPNYQRPPVDTPTAFRGGLAKSTGSIAELPWWKVFRDENLQALIRTALAGNYDLRIAVSRVEQAREFAAQARAGLFPQLNYGAVAARGKNVTALNLPSPTGQTGSVFAADFNISWEIDLWGRIRRLTEAAQAQFLATEEARRGVTISLIAEVAQGYLQLLALERELRIAEETRDAFAGSLQIFTERLEGGVASKLETASASALLDSAAAAIPNIERQIFLQENLLSVLLGRSPGPISRDGSKFDQQLVTEIPAGLPSALLERRPDIRQAEQQLRSANAQIGVAEADCLPQLTLLIEIRTEPARREGPGRNERRGRILDVFDRGVRRRAGHAAATATGEFQSVVLAKRAAVPAPHGAVGIGELDVDALRGNPKPG